MNKKNNNIKKLYPKEGISWKWEEEIGKAYSNKDGKIMNGHHKYYGDDGTISQTGIWTNGQKEDAWQSFYEDGELMVMRSFKDGKKDGLEESYWKNGQLQSKGNYRNGEYDGLWIHYSTKGYLEYKEKYKDGEWLWYEVYYEGGQLDRRVTLKI
tara:strand:- start:152 stop:613 length:462 start_codon:yes stop_codon:yes gene_type:complete